MSVSSVSSATYTLASLLKYLDETSSSSSTSTKKTRKHPNIELLLKFLEKNMVGKTVTVKTTNSSVTGVVQAVKVVNGKLQVVINGVSYDLSDVTQTNVA